MKKYEFHPYSTVLPLMNSNEYKELKESIKIDGLKHKIVLYENKILDGRNRYNACIELGVEPKYIVFTGNDPKKFVIEENLIRRHLSVTAQAKAANKLAKMEQGNPRQRGSTQKEAAKLLGIGIQSVHGYKVIEKNGIPELIKRIDNEEISIKCGMQIARLPEEKQKELLNISKNEMHKILNKEDKKRKEEAKKLKKIKKTEEVENKIKGAIPGIRIEDTSIKTKNKIRDISKEANDKLNLLKPKFQSIIKRIILTLNESNNNNSLFVKIEKYNEALNIFLDNNNKCIIEEIKAEYKRSLEPEKYI